MKTKKTSTRKVEVDVEETVEAPKKVSKKDFKYELTFVLNEVVTRVNTDDVYAELKNQTVPEIISGFTEVTVKNLKTGTSSFRTLRNFETKRLFGDDVALRIFADTLLSEVV